MPASGELLRHLVELVPGLGQLGHADLLQRRLARPHPVDAVDVHRRRDPGVLGLHHADQGRRHDLVPVLLGGQLVEVGGVAGRRPLGDLRALELDRRRRVAGQHLGAQLGQRVGGMARRSASAPTSPPSASNISPSLAIAERVAAGSPLVQKVGLGLGLDAGACRDAAARPRGPPRTHEPTFTPALRLVMAITFPDGSPRMRRTWRHHMAPARLV